MRVLAIECATPHQSVALVEGDRVVTESSYLAEGTRGGRLMPTVDAVMRKAGLAPRDIDVAAVSVGPGSFTGVRVGVATAKGFALGAGARLVGTSTLEALAEGYPVPNVVICALLDAYRGEVYAALFRRLGERLERLNADAVLAPEAVAATVEGKVHLIGNGAARYQKRLEAAFGARAIITEEGLGSAPSAVMVARLGIRQLESLQESEGTSAEVVPVYLRRAEAEVNWEKGLVKSPLAKIGR